MRCRCGRCGRCGKYARCASAASVAGAARVASAAGLAARGIIWLPETSHMASYCCWQAALWYYMAARDKPYGIIGGYGSRMFFSRFHNAWLTVSEASVQCPPANRPADASCRSLVGMGAECSSRVSTMHGQLSREPFCSSRRSTPEANKKHHPPKNKIRKSNFEIDILSRGGSKPTFRKTNYLGNWPAARNMNFDFRFLIFDFRFLLFGCRGDLKIRCSYPGRGGGQASARPRAGLAARPSHRPPPGGGWMDRLTVNRVPCQSARKVSWLTAG